MIVDIVEETRPDLAEYATIPIAFAVREAFDVVAASGTGPFALRPRSVEQPWVKNYDDDGGPERWGTRFDLAHWRFFAARMNGKRIGGAVVVFRAPDFEMSGGRLDVAIVWDIRVDPGVRRRGVGAALMAAVEAWSLAQGAEWLEVETQNINVAACRFYASQGFELRAVNPNAYPTLPDEIQLLWYKRLG
jgi:GNAT superfamily N-acetyltransferase